MLYKEMNAKEIEYDLRNKLEKINSGDIIR